MRHLGYMEIAKRIAKHPLMEVELPTGMYVSIPLPTRRLGGAGYASFAAPTSRRPGQPTIQGAPDRWWLFDADTARLKVYALTASLPLMPDLKFGEVELPPLACPPLEYRALLAEARERISELTPAFFDALDAGDAVRSKLFELLLQVIPAPIEDRHRALVPDFFEWLQA